MSMKRFTKQKNTEQIFHHSNCNYNSTMEIYKESPSILSHARKTSAPSISLNSSTQPGVYVATVPTECQMQQRFKE